MGKGVWLGEDCQRVVLPYLPERGYIMSKIPTEDTRMTERALLGLIADAFRETYGGLPRRWPEIEAAIRDYGRGRWEEGYRAAQEEAAEWREPIGRP
jgi:hypothetical protein